MAFILTGDQPSVTLSPRGSAERVPDTYARPPAAPPADTSVGDALLSLSNIAQGIDDKQAAKDKELAHLYQAQLTAAMQGSDGFNQTVADGVLNAIHPRVRSYVTELYGRSKGEEAYRQWFNSPEGFKGMPDAVLDPAGYQAWQQKAEAAGMAASGEANLWYRNGFIQSFKAGVATQGKTLDANRNALVTQQAIDQSTANILRGAQQGTPDVTRAEDPQKAAALIAKAQELGVDPVHLAAIMSFETKGKFDPNMDHDIFLQPGIHPVQTAGRARGLIGFIPDNWQKYGIKPNMAFEEQLNSVGAYLRDRSQQTGVQLKGLNAAGIYKLVNPGYNSDRFIDEATRNGHVQGAMRFLGYNSNTPRIGGGDPRTQANAAKNDATWGNPDAPDFAANYLTTVKTASGAALQIHKNTAPAFEGFFKELEGMGYKIDPNQTSSYNNRNIRGGSSKSQHAWANAVDINAYSGNGFGPGAKSDLPPNIGDVAAKYGIRWGGTFSRPDPMHFEFVGLPNGEAPPAKAVTLPEDRRATPAPSASYGPTAGQAPAASYGPPTGQAAPEFNPLTSMKPQQAAWRSRFFDANDDFKNINGGTVPPAIAQKLNEEAWKQVKQLALDEHDPSWLDVYPRRHVTTERLNEMRTIREHVDKEKKQLLSQSAAAAKAARDQAEEKWTNDAANLMLRNDKAGYDEHVKKAILAGNTDTATIEKLNVMKDKIGWGGTQIVRDPEAEAATATVIELGMARAAAMGQNPERFLFDYIKENPSAAIGSQQNLRALLEKSRTFAKEQDVLASPRISEVFSSAVAPVFGIDMTTLKTTPKNPTHSAIWLDYQNDMLNRVSAWRADPKNSGDTLPDSLWLREQSQQAALRVIKAYSKPEEMQQLPTALGGAVTPGSGGRVEAPPKSTTPNNPPTSSSDITPEQQERERKRKAFMEMMSK